MAGLLKRVFSLGVLFLGLAICGSSYVESAEIKFIENKGGFNKPQRVSVSPGGVAYVTDAGTEEVEIVDSDGNKSGSIHGTGVPRGVKALFNGNLLVGYTSESGGYVSLYSSTGSFIKYIGDGVGQFAMPTAITVDPSNGNIYVVDSIRNTVYIFDANGNYLSQFGEYGPGYYDATGFHNQFDYPVAITFDAVRREVLVGDQGNYRVKVFNPAGNYLRQFGKEGLDGSWIFGPVNPERLIGRFSKLQGLTVDGQSQVYVVDSFQCAVQVFDSASGNALTVFSDYGKGSGQLKTPVDITIDGMNRLFLADWNNSRLAVYQVITGVPSSNTAPTAPSPVSPSNGTQVGSINLFLTVSNATDEQNHSLEYQFQVDTVPTFNSPSLINATVKQGEVYTTASVAVPLDHITWYWRVKAIETATVEKYGSPWSQVYNFYINATNRAPSAPANPSPTSGSSVTGSSFLSWSASSDPDLYDEVTYTVEVSTESSFSSLVDSRKGVSSTSVSVGQIDNLISGSYYWRVKAVDNHGASSNYSPTASFTLDVATLRVSTTPAGAIVWLDGNYGYMGNRSGVTGSTPLNIDVKPGRHVVRLQLAGYFEYYGSVDIPAGESRTVTVSLVPKYTFSVTDRDDLTTANGIKIGSSDVSITYSAPFVVDWDNDGAKDLLVGDYGGAVYLFRNSGSDASPSLGYSGSVVNTSGDGAYPCVVDWNNDGKKDLLVGTRSGTVWLYLNNGTESNPAPDSGSLVAASGSSIDVGDYARPVVVDWNNDGKKDLLVGGYNGANGFIRLYLNAGTDEQPLFGSYSEIKVGTGTLTVSGPAMPLVYDWNNDGRKDLLVGGGQGVYLYTNTGTDASPVFSSKGEISSLSSSITELSYAVPFVLDWDNTTPPDILVGNSGGTVRLFKK
ncbi:MAG: FG-GAP-like repeat-containing protein [Nitrospirota bacterium]|nr:FG-GAP-like repeat-containing protein [Nitrospirota bacterium]